MLMKNIRTILMVLLVSGYVYAGAAAKAAETPVVHQGAGKVVSVDKAGHTVKLQHEAIKSLNWPAMTMDFKVVKSVTIENLKPGVTVNFELARDVETGKWQIVGFKTGAQ